MKETYVSNELVKAYPNDLKMRNSDGEIVLKTNILVWVKRIDHQVIDFFGPIILDGNSTKKLLVDIKSLLDEGRVYITKKPFDFIPKNIIQSNYQTIVNVNE